MKPSTQRRLIGVGVFALAYIHGLASSLLNSHVGAFFGIVSCLMVVAGCITIASSFDMERSDDDWERKQAEEAGRDK